MQISTPKWLPPHNVWASHRNKCVTRGDLEGSRAKRGSPTPPPPPHTQQSSTKNNNNNNTEEDKGKKQAKGAVKGILREALGTRYYRVPQKKTNNPPHPSCTPILLTLVLMLSLLPPPSPPPPPSSPLLTHTLCQFHTNSRPRSVTLSMFLFLLTRRHDVHAHQSSGRGRRGGRGVCGVGRGGE